MNEILWGRRRVGKEKNSRKERSLTESKAGREIATIFFVSIIKEIT